MNRSRSVAVIAAHPDDEILGAGGVMAAHAAAGTPVHVLILATGLAARGSANSMDSAALDVLRDHARSANGALGVHDVRFVDFPDNQMDSVPLLEVVKSVEAFLKDTAPGTVYTHHWGDLNVDHRVVSKAVLTACRPVGPTGPDAILAFEVPSASEWSGPMEAPFEPTEFVDIAATLPRKLDALGHYPGEMRDWPHPRSLRGVETLAAWRGAQSGFEAAEAFVIIRRRGRIGA